MNRFQRIVPRGLRGGLLVLACAALAPQALAAPFAAAHAGAAAAGLDLPALQLGPPTTRIYRSTSADGRVVFGDHPMAGAREIQVRSFASSSDGQALETARREQAQWRARAEAFDRRQQAREAADADARLRAEARAFEARLYGVDEAQEPPAVFIAGSAANRWRQPFPGMAFSGRDGWQRPHGVPHSRPQHHGRKPGSGPAPGLVRAPASPVAAVSPAGRSAAGRPSR